MIAGAVDLSTWHCISIREGVHLQDALQLLVDWLEDQLDLLMPSRVLARQTPPGS